MFKMSGYNTKSKLQYLTSQNNGIHWHLQIDSVSEVGFFLWEKKDIFMEHCHFIEQVQFDLTKIMGWEKEK